MRNMFVLFLAFAFASISAQTFSSADKDICISKFDFAASSGLADKPINEVITSIGKSFLGTEYKANTLDQGSEETAVVNLTGLDCYTFLESALVFGRCIKKGKISPKDFHNELIKVRYRGGRLKDYPSRLHYFSDWIFDNDRRGIVQNISKELGGKPFNKKVNFMSHNPSRYKQLVEHPAFVDKIAILEEMISERDYYYIPQNKISEMDSKLMDGDIIGITTNIGGLDITHTGIAVRMGDGFIHLMHAPNVGEKVQISDKPLFEYIKGKKHHTGIMVARPLEP